MKQKCASGFNANRLVRPEEPLQMSAQNHRSAEYRFYPDGSLDKIESRDYFHIALEANRKIGGSVDSVVVLQSDENVAKVESVDSKSPKEFLSQLKNYKGESLEANLQVVETPINANIKKGIKDNQEDLSTSNIGTVQSAKAFLNLLPIARAAKKDDIVQLLKSQKLADIKVTYIKTMNFHFDQLM